MVKGNGYLVLGLKTDETIELLEAGTNKLLAELRAMPPDRPRRRMAFRAPDWVSIVRKPRRDAAAENEKGGSKWSRRKDNSRVSLVA